MGQAKLRGTLKERITQGINKMQLEEETRKQREIEIEKTMSSEDKASRHKIRMYLAALSGIIS
jgi:predicted metal-dependent RNase